jgi:hypothetical protein
MGRPLQYADETDWAAIALVFFFLFVIILTLQSCYKPAAAA